MAANQITPEFVEKIKEILKSNGINHTVSEVKVNDSDDHSGANFASTTAFITVTFQDDSKPLNLFVKFAIKGTSHADLIADIQLFKKEVEFCNKYLPEARNICESKGAEDLMEIFPKCYYADESILVFENIVLDKGYELLKFDELQDLEAAKIGVKNIAKYHAISNAVIGKCGGADKFTEVFENFTFDPWCYEGWKKSMEPMLEASLGTTSAILEKSGADRAKEAIEKLKNMKGHIWDKFIEAVTMEEGDYKILIHGDYHNNNMLFKRDGKGQLASQIMVDFQFVRLNTVGIDLGFYLVTSLKPDVRRRHLGELLQLYLDTLNETANKLGYPIAMEMKELRKYFQRSFKLGFWICYGWTNGGAKLDMKEVGMDASNMSSFDEFGVKLAEYLQKMHEKDPDYCKVNAKSILEMLSLYDVILSGSF